MNHNAYQACIDPSCGTTYAVDDVVFACRACGSLLDVRYDWSRCRAPRSLARFENHRRTRHPQNPPRHNDSGVWRFHELLPFADPDDLVTVGEGRTVLQQADELAAAVGHDASRLFLQYEGLNPSGSFKDNGMAAAFSVARALNRPNVACASTGNTSASLALYAARTHTRTCAPMRATVFIGDDKIAHGKLAQTLDHGAKTIQIAGDFDACMTLVQESAARLNLYLMNSVNPFRLEGQKTIMYRVLEGLAWHVPDWIIVPGGNLGNTSAFGKAFLELHELGLVDRMPRLAVINATGASALYELYHERGIRWNDGQIDKSAVDAYFAEWTAQGRTASTVASAIEIGRPVNLPKALRSLDATNGIVRRVCDDAILDAKALVGRHGLGCEPASAAAVAGLRMLLDEHTIHRGDRVVCILTGHALKDATATIQYHTGPPGPTSAPTRRYTNPPVRVDAHLDAITDILARRGS
ncbi:MAG: threonine synthase [Phycisphaerae bacterium]